MISLSAVFYLIVIMFAMIGAMRGWAKEIIVTLSAVLALFILAVLERYVPQAKQFFDIKNGVTYFWFHTAIILVLVFFGYQTPNIPKFSTTKFAREKLSDMLLGGGLGALNGVIIAGSIWYFLDQVHYPFGKFMIPPRTDLPGFDSFKSLLPLLVPRWLGIPMIFFVVILFTIFVLVVII
jgi:uncharacterized membrane protein required for colicin V production